MADYLVLRVVMQEQENILKMQILCFRALPLVGIKVNFCPDCGARGKVKGPLKSEGLILWGA